MANSGPDTNTSHFSILMAVRPRPPRTEWAKSRMAQPVSFSCTAASVAARACAVPSLPILLCSQPAPHLDGHYTIFGEVVEGLEVGGAMERPRASVVPRCEAAAGCIHAGCVQLACMHAPSVLVVRL
jgi:cyclophilin family peptidyl-prolyl cis-trans isomerase